MLFPFFSPVIPHSRRYHLPSLCSISYITDTRVGRAHCCFLLAVHFYESPRPVISEFTQQLLNRYAFDGSVVYQSHYRRRKLDGMVIRCFSVFMVPLEQCTSDRALASRLRVFSQSVGVSTTNCLPGAIVVRSLGVTQFPFVELRLGLPRSPMPAHHESDRH